ncbi:MAG: primosomal protein N' [Defluviitaleaceae bacterium]|nr:primosomal protein N' [Defluviitaleaceae bacterium]
MTTNHQKYALVCVDVLHGDVDRLFHYAIPQALCHTLHIGMRVYVPFGKGGVLKIGYVIELTNTPPDNISIEQVKEIRSTCDDFPVLRPDTLKLARWMKEKYYTTLAACVRCVAPSAKSNGKFPTTRAKKVTKTTKDMPKIILTLEQQHAVNQITQSLDSANNPPILLHGVTGSGKTEVYLHAIAETLARGRQAILLVPEIALTPQMVNLFTARFGEAVAVTHSRLTPGERFQIWQSALHGAVSLIIGPRSAVFAPFENLGLIVIDEEHEHTYHSETSPKYDTREVAIKRMEITGGLVILGSATPGLESYHAAENSQYTLIKLTQRVNKTLPDVTVIDMRQEMARGNISMFATAFHDALAATLADGQQAILFLNRRGHSSFVSCKWCGHVLTCDHCRVNHTYHADTHRLLCHYCGKGLPLPTHCPACSSEHLRRHGTGTQKVEEEVKNLFPNVKTLRMDMDTTKGKHGHEKILNAFRKGDAQVLIGTQMVAKGLDFPKVTMVGVVAADMALYTGDFRAGEYTFQLLTQVAGRAGRAADPGRVFIQTYSPHHYAIEFSKENNYEKFYAHEISLRKAMIYPPFSHVFSIMFTGLKEIEVINALRKLCAIMEYCNKRDGKNRFEIIGISPAFVSMIKKQFRWKLLVKSQEEAPLVAFVLYCIKKLRENDPLKNMQTHLTLNPRMME